MIVGDLFQESRVSNPYDEPDLGELLDTSLDWSCAKVGEHEKFTSSDSWIRAVVVKISHGALPTSWRSAATSWSYGH
ncbi:MAG: hypothetical protein HKL86_07155 [Acidimicrobiaceae bacterium]|nr:hypothetical protein [Acidimicrobiaceae bacterium]